MNSNEWRKHVEVRVENLRQLLIQLDFDATEETALKCRQTLCSIEKETQAVREILAAER